MSKKLLTPDKNRLGRLIETGFPAIPLHHAHAVGKNNKKVGKRPLNARWTTVPLEKPIKLLNMMDQGHNIGVRLEDAGDWLMLVVDVDPRNFPLEGETDKEGHVLPVRPDLALQERFGFMFEDYPTVLTGSWFPSKDPSTGLHVYMKARKPAGWKDGDRLAMHLHGLKGIDFKSVGGQVVAPGSVHPDFNRYYEWHADHPPIEEIGFAPDELVSALHRPATTSGTVQGEGADMTPEMLQELLDGLVVEEFRDHDAWLQMMMACHAATDGEGLNEFIAWSTGDPQYAHVGSDIAYRWETLDAGKAGGITYKTLEKIARDHGVQQMPMSPDEFADLDDEDREATALANQGPQARHPLKELNDRFFTSHESGSFRVYELARSEELGRKTLVRYTKHDFLNLLSHMPKIEQGRRSVAPAAAWLEWPGRDHFDAIQFLPELGDEREVTRGGRRIYNLWSGFGVPPVSKPGGWSLLDELIRTALTGDDEACYEYVLNWMAYAVQYPHRPAEVALVFQGGKGTGKSTLGRVFARLFGDHGMHITSSTLLTGRFNGHLKDVVALFADEAFHASTGSHHAGEQMLKGLITENKIAFEAKGLNPVMGRNTLHVIMASNNDWVIPAGVGERRFAVFRVTNARQQDLAFFAALHRQMEDGGLEALLHDLRERDLEGWHPRQDIPRTAALLDQIEFGQGPVEGFLWEAIKQGDPAAWDPYHDAWAEGGGVSVLCADFEHALRAWLKQFPGNRMYRDEVGRIAVGKKLADVFGDGLEKTKLSRAPEDRISESARPYAYTFPPLARCRETWEARLGTKVRWE